VFQIVLAADVSLAELIVELKAVPALYGNNIGLIYFGISKVVS
jgi:hypothetical protein